MASLNLCTFAIAAKTSGVPLDKVIGAFLAVVQEFSVQNVGQLSAEELIMAACASGLDRRIHDRLLG